MPEMREVVVYSRKGCHLCEILKEKLVKLERRGGFRWREVDVETEDGLRRQFTDEVPLFLRQEPFTRPNVRIRGFMIKPRNLQQTMVALVSFILVLASDSLCQIDEVGQTMRPVIRGRQAAVSSMKPQA